MSKVYEEIDGQLRAFIEAQRVFFVASAPAGTEGHVNVSPKGLDALRILGPKTVAYLDVVGSGAETMAHIRENGRIVLMLCAFDGPPKIVRLYGRGQVIEPQDAEFGSLLACFTPVPGIRSIIRVELERISDSCGNGVPRFRYEGQRTQLPAWAERKGMNVLAEYQRENNSQSLDGLPGLRWPQQSRE